MCGRAAERCHNLGLTEHELARDLESLVWLTTATVSAVQPRVLITHACQGRDLNHDATAFAVHMTARLMTRSGVGAPVVVEVGPHGRHPEALGLLPDKPAVKIEFGPESRKVKRRMLRCHEISRGPSLAAHDSESYVLATPSSPLDKLAMASGPYLDAGWCRTEDFRRHARDVAISLSSAVLSTPSRA